jgi:hypothetical protein
MVAELLASLSDHGNQARDSKPVSEKRQALNQSYPPVTRERLMGIFEKSNELDLRRQRAFVYGPTVTEAGHPILPIVTVDAKFLDRDSSSISVYVMCWVYFRPRWTVLPLRFERPPKDEMTGAHGYNHAQFFWSLLNDGKALVDGENMMWLPEKLPAIPLPQAPTVTSVVATAIVSLYGAIAARPYVSHLAPADLPFAAPRAETASRAGPRTARSRH